MRPRIHGFLVLAATALPALLPAPVHAAAAGVECVIHDWAVPPGQWTGSGDTDPTPLLMTATTRWVFRLSSCSLTSGECDEFGSGSLAFQNGVARPEWHPTDTVPTIAAVGNTVTYDFSMRDAFVPLVGQPRFEDMDWTLSAELPGPPSDSPSAAELAAAVSITVSIDHWVDNTFFEIHWGGGASDTAFASCTPVPTELSVDDVTLAEGSGGGTTPFVFTVTRSHNTDDVLVTAQTADGSAEAGTDYAGLGPILLAFASGGPLTQTVNVDVAADDEFEADESFSLLLSAPSNATIVDGIGVGTILNDDAVAALSVDDVAQAEGDAGGADFVFTVSRSHNHDAVEVTVETVDGTAEAGTDYTAVGPTILVYPAGGTVSQTVSVPVAGDAVVELDESFTVELSDPDLATLADATGLGTIGNDDAALLSIDSGSTLEGTGGRPEAFTFTVTLDTAVDTTLSLDFDSRDGTAEDEAGDGDYAETSGTLSFDGTAGETALVSVDIVPDDRPESDETFFVDLSNLAAGGREVGFDIAEGMATILDDDDACPDLTIYRQPFDSPADLDGHPAEEGGLVAFEDVVDGGGAITTLPPGPVSGVRVWGLGSDGTDPCPLDPQVPFTLSFHTDTAGMPGSLVAERTVSATAWSDLPSGAVRADLVFPPFAGDSVSWISVRRSPADGCAFRWLAERVEGSYDDQVFVAPGSVPDDAYLCVGHPWIFADGFESGDTSAWSQVAQ